ncbi:MAG: LacI family transcriptional regulator [Actinobacteria bacterium]|nr:LacI family transcriptional regulator [Actinomycetota bacterium]
MAKKITIKDIAKEAGVSVATVSNVLNEKSFVNAEMAEKVKKVISKYNFRSNISASVLRKKASKLIGIIIPDSSNLVFSQIGKEIEIDLSDYNYNVVICNSNYNEKKEMNYIDVLLSRNIDGLIIVPSTENISIFKNIKNENIPIVVIDRLIEGLKADFVMSNNYNVMIEVVDYLAGLGHKRIAYINREVDLYHSIKRFEGFQDGLKKNSLNFNKKLITGDGGLSFEDGYLEMLKFIKMDSSVRPTAVIAFNDIVAIGAIRAIKDNNYKVPQDFSIVGFDNIFFDEFLETRLTSVTSNKKEMAKLSVKLLLERINGDLSEPKWALNHRRLVIRESTSIHHDSNK